MVDRFDRKTMRMRKPATKASDDKFAAADKAFEEGVFGDADSRAAVPSAELKPDKPAKKKKMEYTSTQTFSAYEHDRQNREDIMHRLYMHKHKINASEAIRLALHVLAKYDDEQLVIARNEWAEANKE